MQTVQDIVMQLLVLFFFKDDEWIVMFFLEPCAMFLLFSSATFLGFPPFLELFTCSCSVDD